MRAICLLTAFALWNTPSIARGSQISCRQAFDHFSKVATALGEYRNQSSASARAAAWRRVKEIVVSNRAETSNAAILQSVHQECDSSVYSLAILAFGEYAVSGLGNGAFARQKKSLDGALELVAEIVNTSRRSVSRSDFELARSLYDRLRAYYAGEKLAMNQNRVDYIESQFAKHRKSAPTVDRTSP